MGGGGIFFKSGGDRLHSEVIFERAMKRNLPYFQSHDHKNPRNLELGLLLRLLHLFCRVLRAIPL